MTGPADGSRGAGGAAVRLRGFGWRYAGRKAWACRGVDLDLAPGERVLLVGPSGAGKSTLLRAVAGLLDPETAAEHEGSVLVDGVPAAAARDRVGMLLQDPESSLVMSRSGDDVAFGLENAGVPPSEIWPRVDAALAQVGFPYDHDRPTAALSGGEQQRLALAGALVRRPSVLVLDEPTANLDPAGTATVLGAVSSALADGAGTTLLMVEHRVEAAAELVDRVVVLEPGGGVVDDGPPAEVFGRRGAALAAAGVWVPAPWGPTAPPFTPGPGGDVLLTARNLSLTYPRTRRPALSSASLAVRQGTAVAVTGTNGSGKSTLAMLLAGLLPPDTGAVRLGGSERPLHRWRPRDLCRRVGTVFQDPEHQFVTRTARDELLVGPRRAGVPAAEAAARADELLERLRLTRLAGANPFTLSGGEKRRLSVAAMLATAPDLLVMDEPTFGQDARTWAELLGLCVRLRAAGTAIVAVTHDEPFATALADERVTVAAGTVTTEVEVRS